MVLAFHSSLSFVEGSSDGLATRVRALLDGCVSLAPFVVEFSRFCASSLFGLALLAPLGLTEDFCRIQWRRSSRKLLRSPCGCSFSVLSLDRVLLTVSLSSPRAFSPGVVMAPSHGFRLRRSSHLGFWLCVA